MSGRYRFGPAYSGPALRPRPPRSDRIRNVAEITTVRPARADVLCTMSNPAMSTAAPANLRRFGVMTRTGRNPVVVVVVAVSSNVAIMSALSTEEIAKLATSGRRVRVSDDGPATPAEIAIWVANRDAKSAALARLADCKDRDELKARMDEIDAMP